MRITKRVVDAAKPDPKKRLCFVWDGELKGFGLCVLPTGVKSYTFQYRTPEGRARRITIGKHGEWTPKQARDRAEDYRELVRGGGDPPGRSRRCSRPQRSAYPDAYLASESFKDKASQPRTSTEAASSVTCDRCSASATPTC